MGLWRKLAGTLEDWFGIGGEEEIAIGLDGSGNLRFKDKVVVGEPSLTDLLNATAEFDKLIFTTDGGLVYDSNGELVIKEGS